MKYICWFNI